MDESTEYTHVLALPDEEATARLAAAIAPLLVPGDLITLAGDLGSGKTTFARHVIRQVAADPALDVPSPTFSLLQTYDTARGIVVHADLYRIGDVGELSEIGWDEAGASSIVLVEWPERAGGELAGDALALTFSVDPNNAASSRHVTLEPHGPWPERIVRALEIASFLEGAGWYGAQRQHLQGDASSRRYEKLLGAEHSAILMDSPERGDGPPVRDGKPYSRIAHLAENVLPFVAIAQGLREAGFSAPEIIARDLDMGLLIVEDFGHETVLVGGAHAPERLTVAADLLATLHGMEVAPAIQVGDETYHVPPYDLGALLIEVELLVDWYLPHLGHALSAQDRARFVELWRTALLPLIDQPATWVLRDYHSPNLMWLPDREGVSRIGLLDFQDAVMGHPAYDLVSLLQDARVDVPEALEMSLLSRYVGARRAAPAVFDPTAFARAYATLGAQRATKILGIFVRLATRDGKPDYLRHIPRVMRYLDRDLAHPALADLRDWYVGVLGSLGSTAKP